MSAQWVSNEWAMSEQWVSTSERQVSGPMTTKFIKFCKKCVPGHMLKKVSSEWSHQGLSGHPLTTKVMLPPAREHSFHFSTSRPKVLQNGSHGHYWEPFGSPNAPKASPSHHLSHHPRRNKGVTRGWQGGDKGVTRGWQVGDKGGHRNFVENVLKNAIMLHHVHHIVHVWDIDWTL